MLGTSSVSAAPPRLRAVVCLDRPACRGVAEHLVAVSRLPSRLLLALSSRSFRPRRPFSGPLFAAMARLEELAQAEGSSGSAPCVGLVVPSVWLPAGERDGELPGLVVVTDHVNLTLRGPLTGRWPGARPRTFPRMTGVYQPDVAAEALGGVGSLQALGASTPRAGRTPASAQREPESGRTEPRPAVYSRLVVAGVEDASRLSAFEREQVRVAGLLCASSYLVVPVIIAAYYQLTVAAVCVPSTASEG